MKHIGVDVHIRPAIPAGSESGRCDPGLRHGREWRRSDSGDVVERTNDGAKFGRVVVLYEIKENVIRLFGFGTVLCGGIVSHTFLALVSLDIPSRCGNAWRQRSVCMVLDASHAGWPDSTCTTSNRHQRCCLRWKLQLRTSNMPVRTLVWLQSSTTLLGIGLKVAEQVRVLCTEPWLELAVGARVVRQGNVAEVEAD